MHFFCDFYKLEEWQYVLPISRLKEMGNSQVDKGLQILVDIFQSFFLFLETIKEV